MIEITLVVEPIFPSLKGFSVIVDISVCALLYGNFVPCCTNVCNYGGKSNLSRWLWLHDGCEMWFVRM